MGNNNDYFKHQSGSMGSADISGTPRTRRRLLKMESPQGQFGARDLLEYRSSFVTGPVEFPHSKSLNSLKPTESPPTMEIHNTDFINKNEN